MGKNLVMEVRKCSAYLISNNDKSPLNIFQYNSIHTQEMLSLYSGRYLAKCFSRIPKMVNQYLWNK